MSFIEIIGSITGLVGVWLTTRANVWCWVVNAVSIVCYAVLFFQERLYADMALQGVFFAMSVYGWHKWLQNKDTPSIAGEQTVIFSVVHIPLSVLVISAVVTSIGAGLIGWGLHTWTNAALPYLDASLSAVSIAATWFTAKKYVENWLVWIVADVVYVGMFCFKELWLTAALYAVFCVLAVRGYVVWRRFLLLETAQ